MFNVRKGFTAIKASILIAVVALLIVLVGVWYVSKNKAGADVITFPNAQSGQVKFTGYVKDKVSGKGITGATVSGIANVPGPSTPATSDTSGGYSLKLWVKNEKTSTSDYVSVVITANAIGYAPTSVSVAQVQYINDKYTFNVPDILLEKKAMVGIVEGKVTRDGKPVYGASVFKDCGIKGAMTLLTKSDSQGKFTLALAPRSYCMLAWLPRPILYGGGNYSSGEQYVTVEAGKTLWIDFVLK